MTPTITATSNGVGNANGNAPETRTGREREREREQDRERRKRERNRSITAVRASPVGHISDEDTDEATEEDGHDDEGIHTMGNDDVGEGRSGTCGGDEAGEVDVDAFSKGDKRVACMSGCSKTFDTVHEMKRHRANVHPYKFRRYNCSLCGFQVLQWRQNMKRHIRNCHGNATQDTNANLLFTEDFKINRNRDRVPLAIHSTIFNSTPAGEEKGDDAKATRLRSEAARRRFETSARRSGLEWLRRRRRGGVEPTPADQPCSSRDVSGEPLPDEVCGAGDDGAALASAFVSAEQDGDDAVGGGAVGGGVVGDADVDFDDEDEDDSPLDLSFQKH